MVRNHAGCSLDGPLVPIYPGMEAPPEGPLLGVMVADTEAVGVMASCTCDGAGTCVGGC